MQKMAGEDFTFLVEEGKLSELSVRVILSFGRIELILAWQDYFAFLDKLSLTQLTIMIFHFLFVNQLQMHL